MKYNKAYEEEGSFEGYLEYLNIIKPKLPKDIFNFISNPNRHDFSEQSLHDSWVKSIECFNDFKTDRTNITLTLIGANFDREFRFIFQGVSQYKISQQISDINRDLITYEIGIEQDDNEENKFVFRAMFSGEKSEVEVYSEKINISEHIKQ